MPPLRRRAKSALRTTATKNIRPPSQIASQAIALNAPKDESAYYNRCYAYDNLGNRSSAITDCNQAIALNPKDELAYVRRCGVNSILGNASSAIADCNQAIALNPKDAYAYSQRCLVSEPTGKL